MSRSLASDTNIAKPITLIISDVDGVMTDGRIIYDSDGHETKQFHVRDGLGIKLWMRSGFHFAILTARQSEMVTRRADELGIEHVVQGAKDKLSSAELLLETLGCTAEQTCYLGDDLPDLSVMRRVALAVTPADGAADVRDASQWILRNNGGEGAVRELCERLLRAKQRWKEHVK